MVKNIPIALISLLIILTSFSGCLNSDDDEKKNDQYDYYPPNISIRNPDDNDLVSGIAEVKVRIFPKRDVMEMSYIIDDKVCETTGNETWEWNTTEYENGYHVLEVKAVEIGENVPADVVPTSDKVEVNVYNAENEEDVNSKPEIEIYEPNGDVNGIYSGLVTIEGEVYDRETDIESINMKVNGNDWFDVTASSGEWHYELDTAKFSRYIGIEVKAYDGEEYGDTVSIELETDNYPPEISIKQPEEGETVKGTIDVQTEVDDDNQISYISLSIDNKEIENGTREEFEIDTTELQNGEHELSISSRDMNGNIGKKYISINIDNNHSPDAVISSPEEEHEYGEDEEILFDGAESSDPDNDEITYQWSSNIDGELSRNKSFSTKLTKGDHTITLTVDDGEGQKDSESVDITVTEKENSPPEIEITEPENGSSVKDIVNISGTVSDDEDKIESLEYRIDESAWEPINIEEHWSFEINTTEYADDWYSIYVRAEDDKGKENSQSIDLKFVNEGIIIEITEPENGSYLSKNVDILTQVEDEPEMDYIAFIINGEEVQNSTSDSYEWNTTGFEDGRYSLNVTGRSEKGKTGKDTIYVNVDNTPPEIALVSHNENELVKGTILLVSECNDSSPTPDVVYKIDGEIISENGLSVDWDTTSVTDGNHTVSVSVTDAAGNENSLEIALNVDNTSPVVSITEPEDGETIQSSVVTVKAEASDVSGIAKVNFFVENDLKSSDEEEPFSYDVDLSGYQNGGYKIRAVAYDNAGNTKEHRIDITLDQDSSSIVNNPGPYELTPYNTAGKERLVLKEENSQGVPISSSLVKSEGITTSVDWSVSASHDLLISDTNTSLFSSKLAISYWTEPEQAIVVDNYENSLIASPLATYLDVPILLYGDSTEEALWRLGTIYGNQIITVGDIPYANEEGVSSLNKETILNYTLAAASVKGIEIDYMVVTFPGDNESMQLDNEDNRDNYVTGISTFASQFSSYRNGILLTCEGETVDERRHYLNTTIHEWRETIESFGHTIDYLLLNGDYYSLPMIKLSFTMSTVNGGTQTKLIPSDNFYLNTAGNPFQIEIAGGRTVAKNFQNMSYYIDRIVNYDSYLVGEGEPVFPEWTIYNPTYPIYKPWANNALIYQGNGAEFAADSEHAVRNMMHDDGHYHTLDDSALAKECTNSGDARNVLMDDFANSNYIAINADHGEPHQCTLTFASDDLKDMNPSVVFGVSCMLGQIDDTNHLPSGDDSESYNVHVSDSMTYTFLEKGVNSFIGATRTALGSFGATTLVGFVDYTPYQAPGLCYLFSENTMNSNMSTGMALMNAKNDLFSISGDEGNRYSIWEYVHYGDPAFNPYEPCNEGSDL